MTTTTDAPTDPTAMSGLELLRAWQAGGAGSDRPSIGRLLGMVPKQIDEGAVTALRERGRSLLPAGITGVTTPDGRFTIMMPHPERVFRNAQMSWTRGEIAEFSPWQRMFRNARRWVG